jgi:electron transfer flavoprotein alpha subunit
MRIAVLVKQVPKFEAMSLGPDGRLVRTGLELEMNPYCRRAVAKGVELAASSGGTCTVFTLGPPSADDVLREAIAWGADGGVLVTDPVCAGSDTLATARALAAALRLCGPFDLVLAGRNSVDADTGQVGPEVAELLDLPFLAGVRELAIDASSGAVQARCEYDDGFVVAATTLPALVSCAERLTDPAKVPPEGRAAVDASRIRRVSADELGGGPWGQAGSPTRVGRVEQLSVERSRIVLSGPVEEQVEEAVRLLLDRGALEPTPALSVTSARQAVPDSPKAGDGRAIAVIVEPRRERTARELLGAAAGLGGRVVAVAFDTDLDAAALSSYGADTVVRVEGVTVEEDVARALGDWVDEARPWAVLAPGTMWGREVASRVAARLGAGLTGDAVDLAVEGDRLVGWKPAFGGALVAAVTAVSDVQMVTVRPGVLALPEPRAADAGIGVDIRAATPRGRVRHLDAGRDDDLDALVAADVVVGVGTAVAPDEYDELRPLLDVLGAELGATRKVTDRGWLPRARQIGITGRSIGPRLYVAVGLSGKFNHVVGVRGAGCVLAINSDPDALVFGACDIGIVGDWHTVVPLLVDALGAGDDLAVNDGEPRVVVR